MDAAYALARFATTIRYEDLPADVVESTKKQILDVLGVTLGGRYATSSGTAAKALPYPRHPSSSRVKTCRTADTTYCPSNPGPASTVTTCPARTAGAVLLPVATSPARAARSSST